MEMREDGPNMSTFTSALVVDERTKLDEKDQKDKCSQLQSLPFFMDFTGPALVSKFFHTEQFDGTVGLKAALFRGHLLLGKTVKAPDGFSFCAVKENQQSVGDVKTYKVIEAFPTMDVWEYDEPPENHKKSLQNALVALQIANDLAS